MDCVAICLAGGAEGCVASLRESRVLPRPSFAVCGASRFFWFSLHFVFLLAALWRHTCTAINFTENSAILRIGFRAFDV